MEDNTFETRVDLTALRDSVEKIRNEVGKVIVGQDQMITLLITAILADGHVLIEGVPGVAKTLTAKLMSNVISVDFSRIQFTPDLMPSDVLGTSVYNMKTSARVFKAVTLLANSVLIDQINPTPAKTQAALFEVMEERQVTIDGHSHQMKLPLIVIATQNPIEHEGTYRLPEAQLDRFLFKIAVEYPSLDQEVSILSGHQQRKGKAPTGKVSRVLTPQEIAAYRAKVHEVYCED